MTKSATGILFGQILVVFGVALGGVWAATQWTARALGYQPRLGSWWFDLYGVPIAMTASIYLLPQKRWRQSGPCSDAEFRVLGFGRMAHAVGPRSRRR
jgi:type IV secretory pathway TraG/TraD family ATPase VirD4